MCLIEDLVKVALKESQIFCGKLLQSKKEQINFAKNHSMYMN